MRTLDEVWAGQWDTNRNRCLLRRGLLAKLAEVKIAALSTEQADPDQGSGEDRVRDSGGLEEWDS